MFAGLILRQPFETCKCLILAACRFVAKPTLFATKELCANWAYTHPGGSAHVRFSIVALVVPLIALRTFWRDARLHGWAWINAEGLKMYVDAAKTFLTASAIAVAIVVASLVGSM
jgi:hypothetical protein